MKKKFAAFPLMVLLSLCLSAIPAFAATPDGAGNLFLNDEEPGSNVVCSSDFFWVGFNLDMDNSQVAGEAFLAGETLDLADCQIGGSLRGAGNTLRLADCTVGSNITAAGNTLRIGEGTTARGVYLAGNSVQFDGTSDYLVASGNHVTLNGTVNGDVNIDAQNVTIGDNAVVTGNLSITAESEPSIPATAKVGELDYSSAKEAESTIGNATVVTVTTASTLMHIISKMAYRIGAYLLVALLFCWVLQKALRRSVETISSRPAPTIVSGIVALIAMPIALAILCITVIGIPLAAALSLLMVVVTLLAMPFTGVAVGQKVFPKMNRWLSGLIGAAIIAVLSVIPFLGLLVRFCCMAFVIGFLLQALYGNMQTAKRPATSIPPIPCE